MGNSLKVFLISFFPITAFIIVQNVAGTWVAAAIAGVICGITHGICYKLGLHSEWGDE